MNHATDWVSSGCSTSVWASPWPVFHGQGGRDSMFVFTNPWEEDSELCPYLTELCGWELKYASTGISCPTCSLSVFSWAAIPWTPGTNPTLSAGIHNFPRSNLEFVITAAHRLTQADTTPTKILGAFLRCSLRDSHFSLQSPTHHLTCPTMERWKFFFWYDSQVKENLL